MSTVSRIQKQFKKGDVILQEGAAATEEIFFLHRGTCTAEVKGALVGEIQSGEFFGEVASIHQTDRSATVRAATDCLVYVFKGLYDQGLFEMVAGDHRILRKLFEQMAIRLVESSHRHAGDAGKLTALASRFQSAISGALYALEQANERKSSPFLTDLSNFLKLQSGLGGGRPQDCDRRFFPNSKELIS